MLPPLHIGSLPLATNLLLAPIAGYCDVSFRLVARAFGGVGLACTDLLCPEGVLRENKRSMELAATCPEDSPLSMQLYGGNVDRLCEAAMWAEDRGAHVIDINMGCPVDKITKKDGGSKLLCDPDHTLRMVEKVKSCLRRVPLTCKLRLGWNDQSIVAPYLAARLEEQGVSLITIHGRTTEMKFTGSARLDGIAQVVAAVKKIPVIGNGDIKSPHDAARMIAVTKCAGVMIGRGALVRPWIFRDTHALLTTGQIPAEPSIAEKCAMIRHHFYNLCRFRNERIAVLEFRKRISWYAKTMNPCRPLKDPMREISSPADFENVLTGFLEWREGYDAAVRAGKIAPLAEENTQEAA
ncbi:MAG TPA: tRNA dihydrouridine synthase DusB [Phycisphaerae bacterium]|jgi:nifR3 family TIM-barrel protein|nr:tRNA dihydrouridine synthase DusB [Phycisphaerae bacterium]